MDTPSPAKLPEVAEKAAYNLRAKAQDARQLIAALCEQGDTLHMLVQDITNANLCRGGFEIEDIPEYAPLQVVYDPSEDDCFHAIACRGVDLTGFVSSDVERAAMEVVHEAWMEAHDEQRHQDRDAEHKLDIQRGK